ncbi:hypothetical protein LCGC14_2410520 [marine sediment metagenome]|uniref:Uncharacterized protein n=1 Tax=marine sediment metagenome TaxID=412755 RepID=A0A0F9BSI3_9ZZZZ
MKDLDGLRVFLSGPVDRVADDGVLWRKEFKNKCKKAKLPFTFFDPCHKPKGMGSEIGDEKLRIQRLMKQKKWEQAKIEVKIFSRYDLRMVDLSHLLVLYCDINVHLCGSYEEFVTAKRQHKPCFVIMAEGQEKYDIPIWLIQHVDEDEVFNSIEECVTHLKLMYEGKILTDDRWVIV